MDLYLTNLGPDVLYRNNGDGTFTDVTEKAGIRAPGWSSSAAFGDFDRDGHLDLYVAAYLDVGPDKLPEGRAGGTCSYLGVTVLCGPRGLPGARDLYFHNNGNGTFTEQSEASGAFDKEAYFGLGVVASDLDGDGDLDLYVGNDATPNYLFVNRGDGRFDERGFQSGTAVSGDGNEQASMGVDAADYDNDGRPDLYAAHFASDYSTLYRNLGGLLFEDVTARARIKDPGWALVKWGTGFLDLDQDGWLDLVHANGHVYPHLRGTSSRETYEQPALSVYRSDGDGTFRRRLAPAPGRRSPCSGAARRSPTSTTTETWTWSWPASTARPSSSATTPPAGTGSSSGRSGGRATATRSGRRSRCGPARLTQLREVKRTLRIYSASDPRAHFGLGPATKADLVRVEWPSGKGGRVEGRAGRPALPGGRGGGAQARAPPRAVSRYLTSTQWRPTYSRPFVNCSGTGWASAASHCAATSPTLAPATS